MGGGCCGGGGSLGGGNGGGGKGCKPALLEVVGISGGGLVGGGGNFLTVTLGNLAFTTVGCLAGLGATGSGTVSRAGTATPPYTKVLGGFGTGTVVVTALGPDAGSGTAAVTAFGPDAGSGGRELWSDGCHSVALAFGS